MFRRLLLLLMAMGLRRDPDQFTARSMDVFSDPDRQLLDKPKMAQMYVATLLEAFRTGTGGALQDAALYPRPWGFRLQDISAAVHLWHGESDANVLVAVGRYVADALPNCRAVFMKDEGHFTLPHNHIREILKVLAD